MDEVSSLEQGVSGLRDFGAGGLPEVRRRTSVEVDRAQEASEGPQKDLTSKHREDFRLEVSETACLEGQLKGLVMEVKREAFPNEANGITPHVDYTQDTSIATRQLLPQDLCDVNGNCTSNPSPMSRHPFLVCRPLETRPVS
ncbi:hypothetical protein NHX12_033572 [Muraenolepis orangiensis]|uniref:Uncharacterized protein n=1 Tax=Muraenolepis orangiensis TaxID=630683 RepID=A0A9Q0E3M9_9TELE|nr:hypothetical protein NHX12_033572 [Muraenolepis orangiensis]